MKPTIKKESAPRIPRRPELSPSEWALVFLALKCFIENGEALRAAELNDEGLGVLAEIKNKVDDFMVRYLISG